jgi:hypothetical protein
MTIPPFKSVRDTYFSIKIVINLYLCQGWVALFFSLTFSKVSLERFGSCGMPGYSREEKPQHMKRTTRKAARGSRGSTGKRVLALLSDATPLFWDGVETSHEVQATGGKLHFSLSRTIRYPVTDMMRTIRMASRITK